MLTTHVIYHADCYDGFGAAWAAWTRLGDKATYIPAFHGTEPPDFPKDAHVVIVDFSYPRKKILELKERVASLVILDHHKTAEDNLGDLSFAIFDMNHSGAWLSWEYFRPHVDTPELINYLEDRDLWRFKLPKSKEVSAALQAYPFEFDVWEELSFHIGRLKSEGEVVLRLKNQLVKTICENARWLEVGGYKVPVANTSVFFSEVGQELCRMHPGALFGAFYYDRKDGRRQWGLRPVGEFDVSAVAKKLGGGGHKAASGFYEPIP